MTRLVAVLALLAAAPGALSAQKDWYNLDRGRPFRVEDARALERRALELSLVPLEWETQGEGSLRTHAEVTAGLFPRTQVALGLEGRWDAPTGGTAGVAGLELGLLHALNVETLSWPALAVRAGVHAPLGGLAGDAWVADVGVAATRTLGRVRVHVSGAADVLAVHGATDPARGWWAGVALDYAWPLDATLVGAELVRLDQGGTVGRGWEVGLGLRRQLTPRTLAHAGIHHQTEPGAWRLALGFGYALGF